MRLGDTIYFDYQSTTPLDERVLSDLDNAYRALWGNPHSVEHAIGWRAEEAVSSATASIAGFIGADPDELIFTSGATEANNLALLGVATASALQTRPRILVSAIEHKCVLEAARTLETQGKAKIESVRVNSEGFVDLNDLETRLDNDVLLVSVMAVNNEIGTIQPLSKIGQLAEKHGTLFHCDAAQAPVATDIDVFDNNIDLLSLSGHKIYGPKGIGALYVRRDLIGSLQPIIYGGGQQQNLRSGTIPTPLCIGMASAIKLLQGDEALTERRELAALRDRFVQLVCDLGWPVRLNGPTSEFRHPGNANLCFDGFSGADILNVLQPRLAASTGSACTSGIVEPSYVLSAIGLPEDQAKASLRFSIGRFTTEDQVVEAVGILDNALQQLAKESA